MGQKDINSGLRGGRTRGAPGHRRHLVCLSGPGQGPGKRVGLLTSTEQRLTKDSTSSSTRMVIVAFPYRGSRTCALRQNA